MQITAENYYRGSLALPILVPLAAIGWRAATGTWDNGGAGFAGLLALSLAFGGVPYLLTVGLMLWWMRGRNAAGMARLSWLAPLVMVPIAALCWLIYIALDRGGIGEGTGFVLVLTPFVLLFGYAYVALVHAGLLILRATGVVAPPSASSSQSATAAQVASEKPL